MRTQSLLVATVFFVAAAVALAQRPTGDPRESIPRVGEVMDVSIVNLDVVVTDRKGQRVHGLTKDDFEIRENGKLQPITNFAEYGGEERDPERLRVERPPTAAAPGPLPPRTIVIVMEQQAMLPFRRDELFAALGKLIDDAMRPGDQGMVLTCGPMSLHVRQAMTVDRHAIHAALDDVAKQIGPLTFDPAKAAQKDVEDQRTTNAMLAGMPGDPRDPRDLGRPCAEQQLVEIKAKARALSRLMNSMGGIAGRKVMLMAMHRFGYVAGAECFDMGVVPLDKRDRYTTEDFRAQVIDAANANGFTIYPVYPGTIEGGTVDAESTMPQEIPGPDDRQVRGLGSASILLNESQSLFEIADKTGGATEWGSNIVKLLPRIDEDLESYYSLAYSGSGVKDRVRKVVVTTRRPGLRVRTRTEIVEKSDAARMKDRITAALSYVVDEGTLGARAAAETVRRKGRNRFTLPLKVRIPIGQLMTVRKGDVESGAFSVFVGAGNGEVLFSDVIQRTQTFTIPLKDLERAKQGYFTYEVDLTIDSKVNRAAVAIYDEVGRQYGVLRIDNLSWP